MDFEGFNDRVQRPRLKRRRTRMMDRSFSSPSFSILFLFTFIIQLLPFLLPFTPMFFLVLIIIILLLLLLFLLRVLFPVSVFVVPIYLPHPSLHPSLSPHLCPLSAITLSLVSLCSFSFSRLCLHHVFLIIVQHLPPLFPPSPPRRPSVVDARCC